MPSPRPIGEKLYALSDHCNRMLSYLRDEMALAGREDLAEMTELLRRDIVNELSPLILLFQMYYAGFTLEDEPEQSHEVGR